jgi:hypothetical protein
VKIAPKIYLKLKRTRTPMINSKPLFGAKYYYSRLDEVQSKECAQKLAGYLEFRHIPTKVIAMRDLPGLPGKCFSLLSRLEPKFTQASEWIQKKDLDMLPLGLGWMFDQVSDFCTSFPRSGGQVVLTGKDLDGKGQTPAQKRREEKALADFMEVTWGKVDRVMERAGLDK